MANKRAGYRTRLVLDAVQRWYDYRTADESIRRLEQPLVTSFWQYTRWVVSPSPTFVEQSYEAVVAYDDFCRALFALGVVNIVTEDDKPPIYTQLPEWRPSLDLVRRFKVSAL